jgi:hypothetical protein
LVKKVFISTVFIAGVLEVAKRNDKLGDVLATSRSASIFLNNFSGSNPSNTLKLF